jgi:prepilin-type N-terminal cleavage/methylation domain-containing protein
MHKTTRRSHAGFTLIELLTVIAIIGILAAILFPAIGAAKKAAQKSNDLANIRTIGQAALIYASDNGDYLPDPIKDTTFNKDYFAWFGMLAKAGNLTDPKVLYSRIDDKQDGVPLSILAPLASSTSTPTLLEAFTSSYPSYEVIGGLKSSDSSNCPIVYTRGLKDDGTWDTAKGVYGTDGGGLIVFMAGNVTQFKEINLTTNTLIQTSNKAGKNIRQTVPNRTNVKFYGSATYSGLGATLAGISPIVAD